MPAAAVIPAPIAYIKVVAVKKLVVEFLAKRKRSSLRGTVLTSLAIILSKHSATVSRLESVTLRKLECSKQAYCLEYIQHGIMRYDLGSILLV